MEPNFDRVGEWTKPWRYQAEEQALRAYAQAVGVVEADPSRSYAQPLFGVVPAREPMLEAMRAVVPEKMRTETSVHGEHDLVLRRVIEPGMIVDTRAAVVGVRVVSAGTQIVTKTESTLSSGEPIDEQLWTSLLRGVDVGWSGGVAPPAKPSPDDTARPDFEVRDWISRDQSRRYAEATGDTDAYVLDEKAALAAGFPGIILHGLCTMAFAARAVVDACAGGDGRRVQRLGVRFTRPLLLGQEITTLIRRLPAQKGEALYTFDVTDESGAAVIRRGIAEFR